MKKRVATWLGLVLVGAFVLAPTASASPVLTYSNGVQVPTGSAITLANTANYLFTGPFNVTCSSAHLAGSVTQNSGNSIQYEFAVGSGTFSGTDTGSDCTSALGATKMTMNSKLCFVSAKTPGVFDVTGCNGAAPVFTFGITGAANCKYETAKITATYTTAPTLLRLTMSEQALKGVASNSFLCPSSGNVDVDYTATSSGTALVIS